MIAQRMYVVQITGANLTPVVVFFVATGYKTSLGTETLQVQALLHDVGGHAPYMNGER